MKRQAYLAVALAAMMFVTVEAQGARTFWTLDFQHTDMRYVVSGGKTYAYMTYEVSNKTGAERAIAPIFRVETETGQTTYAMPAAAVANAVSAKQGKKYIDVNQITGKIADGETKTGVAVFINLDPSARHVKVYVTGFTDAYRYQDEDARKGFQRMEYKIEWFRPSDAENRMKTPVETKVDEWYWVSTDTAGTAPEGAAETPVRVPGEPPPPPPAPAPAPAAPEKPATDKPADGPAADKPAADAAK